MNDLRPELTPLPRNMLKLFVDDRGYPVPWFVPMVNGLPEFRAMDRSRWKLAVTDRRCWVCGDPLGAYLSFVLGPMCAITRTTAEPPCHRDCAEWSAINCPFLSRPHAKRREDDTINGTTLSKQSAGIAIERNPGATAVWTTKKYHVFSDGKGGQLIQVGEPSHVGWFALGRAATREEVDESIRTGLPLLMEQADLDRDPREAHAELDRAIAKARALLPNDLTPA